MSLFNRRQVLLGGAALAAVTALGLPAFAQVADRPVKAAFVYVGPVGDFGYSFAHDQGRKYLAEKLGDKVQTSFVENVAEGRTPSASSASSPRTATTSSSPPRSAS